MKGRGNQRLLSVAGFAILLSLIFALNGSVHAQNASTTVATSTAATSTPPVSTRFSLGDHVYVASGTANVRSTPGTSAKLLGTQASGTPATIVNGPVSANALIWWHLDYATGPDGWTVETSLAKPAPTSTIVWYSPVGEKKLTSILTRRANARVSGDKVVWEDGRNGASDIYLFDVTANVETRLTGGKGISSHPSVSGARVAYLDREPDPKNPDHDTTFVYVRDLASESTRPLDLSSGFQSDPEISGDAVAYVQTNGTGGRTIVLYNLLSNASVSLFTGTDVSGLRFAGDYLVWMDSVNGVWKVFEYNLRTNAKRQIFNDPGDQMSPDVSSDGRVVFADRRGGGGADDWNVYLYDGATDTAGPITKGSGSQPTGLSVSGNFASWATAGEIYSYNATTDAVTKLTNLPGERSDTSLDGSTLVWLDGRNGGDDVYLSHVK